jgi:glutamate synthase domain-containing protein 2
MWEWFVAAAFLALLLVIVYDVTQRTHAIIRNFPVIGHFRYWLEAVGPELRQYIVTGNDEERPFSRDQRRWVYASAKRENNYFGFGTDNDLDNAANHIIVKQSTFPLADPAPGQPGYDGRYRLPCAKVLGAWRQRPKAFRPASVINISGMSYGSLSANAVEALNRGAELAGCLQSTGEGGISRHHKHGGDLIWQVGTGYFGCRDAAGRFDRTLFKDAVAANQVKAVEIKLSQGAKAGLGGILPKAKISQEIAEIRGITRDGDCISPPYHSEFHDPDSMLDFAEELAQMTGMPIGIKSAVGESEFWVELAHLMATTGRGVDFINVDGGEGGTGAGPLVFTDHVALPFRVGFPRVYRAMAEEGLHEKIVFVGAGRLGFPDQAQLGMALGCDLINVGREAMLSVGCIQAQRCHTGECPTGVATQNPWLVRGLDPALKSVRAANYITTLRKELLQLARACGHPHPALVGKRNIELLNGTPPGVTLPQLTGYDDGWGFPSPEDQATIAQIMADIQAENPTGILGTRGH